MTEKELRQAVCRQAESWLGRKEADNSHMEIIDCYNRITPLPGGYRMKATDPWCAAFVSAVGQALGLTNVLLPECSCDRMIARYQGINRWEEADEAIPRPGDLIFYDWQDDGVGNCRGGSDHVGLVTQVDGDLFTVIEGNTSDAVGKRRIHADSRFIRGFARPDYASAAEEQPKVRTPETTAAKASENEAAAPNCTVTLPQLRRGQKGDAVRALQLLLIARGYRCGPWGADGDFGDATYGAVYRFQRGRQLPADGIVGEKTWTALVGNV